MSLKLSILICSLVERDQKLKKLLASLPTNNPDIEILINIDNREKPIGKKRNELLEQAAGDYIAFIDDDDTVSENYVPLILEALKTNPDCIGIEGIYTIDGFNPAKFTHSIKYDRWFSDSGVYYRCPNHLNPVKRSIALSVGFPDEKSFSEDMDYSIGLVGKLSSEVYIDEPLYFYLKTNS